VHGLGGAELDVCLSQGWPAFLSMQVLAAAVALPPLTDYSDDALSAHVALVLPLLDMPAPSVALQRQALAAVSRQLPLGLARVQEVARCSAIAGHCLPWIGRLLQQFVHDVDAALDCLELLERVTWTVSQQVRWLSLAAFEVIQCGAPQGNC
jgi:hypothetical protein